MPGHDIVVIGGSAGSTEALLVLLEGLKPDLPAAVFFVSHMGPRSDRALARILARARSLDVRMAQDGEAITHGVMYLARPDRHLVLGEGVVRLTRGPRENRWRPSIDALFRSAAATHGSRVIGVVLSGLLDDGTDGLLAIKRCGGLAVAQDPEDAKFPDMPRSALENVAVDHVAPAGSMGALLHRLVAQPAGPALPVPPEIIAEVRAAESGVPVTAMTDEPRQWTDLICPECGGPLQEQRAAGAAAAYKRYRCMVGHGWSPRSLLSNIDGDLESALWAAVRLFRQRANLLTSMAGRERAAGRGTTARHYETVVQETLSYAGRLQDFVMNAPGSGATREYSAKTAAASAAGPGGAQPED